MIEMFKQKYLWIVERKIGSWVGFVTKGRKGPQPDKQGFMSFSLGKYPIDPNKFRIFHIPKGIRPGDNVKVQVWKEDEPTPLDFFKSEKKIGDDITATMIQRLSKIKRLELITNDSNLDKVTIFLSIALIVAVVVIGVLAYVVVNK